jgi:hypothetical protein
LRQPVRSAYQPPASSTFLSEQISHQQSASSTFLSEQISTSHQPPAKRTDRRRSAVPLSVYNCRRRPTSSPPPSNAVLFSLTSPHSERPLPGYLVC